MLRSGRIIVSLKRALGPMMSSGQIPYLRYTRKSVPATRRRLI